MVLMGFGAALFHSFWELVRGRYIAMILYFSQRGARYQETNLWGNSLGAKGAGGKYNQAVQARLSTKC